MIKRNSKGQFVKGTTGYKPMLGKIHSEKTKERLRKEHKGKRFSKRTEFKKGFIPWNKGKKGLQIGWNKGLTKDTHPSLSIVSEKQSKFMKKQYKNPEFIKKYRKFMNMKPNKIERGIINILNKHNLPYKYVGDFQFVLGGKCPDFMNVNGQKKVIELFGDVFHDPKKTFKEYIPYNQTKKGTIEHYRKYGFKCLVIWEHELKDMDSVLQRIEVFENF